MRYIIGIDEVGRGALAGPVTVAAAAVLQGLAISQKQLGKLRDSKKLTAKQRERWFSYFAKHPHVAYAVARVYPRGIERMNISRAANLAALRAFERLTTSYSPLPNHSKIYLDGGLYLGNSRKAARGHKRKIRGTIRKSFLRLSASSPRVSATTVVRGDEKIPAVKIASIIAKVHRDRYMVRLAQRYPKYGFEIHKGYGTKKHQRAIKKHGHSEMHRLTFVKRFFRPRQ